MSEQNARYVPLPQPDDIPVREREDAMGAYLMMFASVALGLPLPVLNLVAAIIYLYLHKNKSRFIFFHALQSLLSQIPVSLLNAGLVIWFIVCLAHHAEFPADFKGYAIMTGIANIIYFVFSLVAAVKARRGLFYYFVFFGRIAYHQAYLNRPLKERPMVNLPPK